jgi:hypothetical protein
MRASLSGSDRRSRSGSLSMALLSGSHWAEVKRFSEGLSNYKTTNAAVFAA